MSNIITPESHIKTIRIQEKKLLIVILILLDNTLRNVDGTVWRMFILMLECNGFKMEDRLITL